MSVSNTDKTAISTPFGQWLSRQRKTRDLTQEELADRLGCSVWSIQKIEVGNRRPSKQLVEILAAYFAIPDAERAGFLQFARGQGPVVRGQGPVVSEGGGMQTLTTDHWPLTPAGGSSPGNLPVQLTSFVGRKIELPRIRDLVLTAEVRLLTLTGPPGTGKTRLALQVAAELRRDFSDGVFFVNLAPINDPGLVISEIAQTLDVREGRGLSVLESVREYLRDRSLLLVLDNFEQVVEAAPVAGELLMAAPRLKVIATSRVPLHIRGEKEFAVPSLHLPDPEHLPPLGGLDRYEAVRLFIERAVDVKDNFELTGNNAATIARICTQLDGLPLAIELAAARVKVLSPQAILTKLESSLDLLTGGPRDQPLRQRTLRDAIEWSYDLLDEEEQKLFRRLAVFVGGLTLGAAGAVCNAQGDLRVGVLDGVYSLIDKSLLRAELAPGQEPGEVVVEPRWGMLETIHEYAQEKLLESGEAGRTRGAHALYFMKLVEQIEPNLKGAGQQEWLDRLEDEHDNLRAALQWAIATSGHWPLATGQSGPETLTHERSEDSWPLATGYEAVEIGLRTAGALWQFWSIHGYLHEGREQLTRLLERSVVSGQWPVVSDEGGIQTLTTDHWPLATVEEAQQLRAYRAKALNGAGVLADLQGDFSSAVPLHEESLAIMRELGDTKGIVVSLNNLGAVAQQQGDYAVARSLYEESLALKRELGDKWSVSIALSNLGLVAQQQGDYTSARSLYAESLTLARELEDKKGVGISLNNLGLVAQLQGDHEAARSLYEESLTLKKELGDKRGVAMSLSNLGLVTLEQGDYATALSQFRESLSLRRELGDKWGIALSLAGLGGVAVAEAVGSRQSARVPGNDQGGGSPPGFPATTREEAVGSEQPTAGKGAVLPTADCRLPTAERGARLLGAVEALLESIGAVLSEEDLLPYERAVAGARTLLGPDEFERLCSEGRAMSMEQAIDYALEES